MVDYIASVACFRALGDENRLRILTLLQNGELCACKLLEALQITQPTLSHHMKTLCDCGMVVGRRDGKWTHYSISSDGVGRLLAVLQPLAENRR